MTRRLRWLLLAGFLALVPAALVLAQATGVNPPVGSVWTYLGATYGAGWGAPQGPLTPQAYGCQGDGVTDDTLCLQAAINGAAATGMPLYFSSTKLYKITGTLNLTQPVALTGPPFRYGIWPVNQPANIEPKRCPWGIVTYNTGIVMINASAVTGSITGLCIDSTGDDTLNPTAGAAIMIRPPSITTYSSGWDVQLNTLFHPYRGLDLPGWGLIPTQCCGVGTTSNGINLSRNTIISPTLEGISLGRNHAAQSGGPGGPGITAIDNSINCQTATSQAGATGLALYEGAVWYNGTQNGPHGCHIGVKVSPGPISGYPQYTQLSADGVLGDQSGLYNLLIQPTDDGTTGGIVFLNSVGGTQPWANATGNSISVKIDCGVTYPKGQCQNFNFSNVFFMGGNGLTQPIMDIQSGPNGPFDILITGSRFCTSGNPAAGSIGINMNIVAGTTGRYSIVGNRIGAGCFGQSIETGIKLAIDPLQNQNGTVIITNNDISHVTYPITYAPNYTDYAIIANNMGVDEAASSQASASTVTLAPNAARQVTLTGTTTVTHLLGGWQQRRVNIRNLNSPLTLQGIGGTGSGLDLLCGSDVVLSQNNSAVDLIYNFNTRCWSHIP